MNRMGIRAVRTMKFRMEAHRYMGELSRELAQRGIDKDASYWLWEIYEDSTHFLYELKHNPETYNMTAKDGIDQVLIVDAIALQVNTQWRKNREFPMKYRKRDLLKMIVEQIKDGGIEDKYISELERVSWSKS